MSAHDKGPVQHWYTQILGSQVCTFNQAIKLKAWKVQQTSLFYFSQWQAADMSGITIGMECMDGLAIVMPGDLECCTESSMFSLSAYTVAELFAMIGFESGSLLYGISANPETKQWYRTGFHINTAQPLPEILTKPLAEALGDLLLFMIDKGQITIEEANARLLQLHQSSHNS